jgi:DNA-binding NtrC family response regulator
MSSEEHKYTILLVEDDKSSRDAMSRFLQRKGYKVTVAESGEVALQLMVPSIDIILSDLKMPGMDGIELLSEVKKLYPDKPFFLFTAYGDIKNAVEAIKLGAEDFLTKPVDPDELMQKLENIKLYFVKDGEKRSNEASGVRRQIIGKSEALNLCLSKVAAVSRTNCTVLITGESGTGKELVAKAIHQNSSRNGKPYIAFSAAELTDTLVESELFGHKKGAFTGADRDYPGKFKMAQGGTLFFDEIGELTPTIQAKILRTLENKEVTSLGDTRSEKLDVRMIFATNRDLEEEVKNGNFREDLFYRINVVNINIPPLRERHGDIKILAEYFVNEFSNIYDKGRIEISSQAIKLMEKYTWPGNVRELRNTMESIVVIMDSNIITHSHLPQRIREFQSDTSIINGGFKIGMSMKEVEKEVIIGTLRECGGNRRHASEILGLSVRTLQRKIKEYGIEI